METAVALSDSSSGRARMFITDYCAIFYLLWGVPTYGNGIVLFLPKAETRGRVGVLFEYDGLYWIEALSEAQPYSALGAHLEKQIPILGAMEEPFATSKRIFAAVLLSEQADVIAALAPIDGYAKLAALDDAFDAAVAFINTNGRPADHEEEFWRMVDVGDWRARLWAPITN